MSDLHFRIVFHTGFRVSTGTAAAGTDDTVDADEPLPSTALKGLMRAAARTVLPGPDSGGDHPLVNRAFGDPRTPCPWNWSSAHFPEPPAVHTRAHVAIDSETGSAARDMLRFAQEHWATAATFDILNTGRVADLEHHRLLLAAAAQAVHAVGSDRRRGLGWVTVTCTDRPITRDDIDTLLRLRRPAVSEKP